MNRKLVPGKNFKQLIQGTESTRQYHSGIAHIVDGSFTDVHIICYDQFGNMLMLLFPFYQHFRYYAYYFSAIIHTVVRNSTHQSFATPAKNYGNVMFS